METSAETSDLNETLSVSVVSVPIRPLNTSKNKRTDDVFLNVLWFWSRPFSINLPADSGAAQFSETLLSRLWEHLLFLGCFRLQALIFPDISDGWLALQSLTRPGYVFPTFCSPSKQRVCFFYLQLLPLHLKWYPVSKKASYLISCSCETAPLSPKINKCLWQTTEEQYKDRGWRSDCFWELDWVTPSVGYKQEVPDFYREIISCISKEK